MKKHNKGSNLTTHILLAVVIFGMNATKPDHLKHVQNKLC